MKSFQNVYFPPNSCLSFKIIGVYKENNIISWLFPFYFWASVLLSSCWKYRSRSVLKYGQFGGKLCFEPLGDKQSCVTDQVCPEEEIDCGEDGFRCANGRLTHYSLKILFHINLGDATVSTECANMVCSEAIFSKNREFQWWHWCYRSSFSKLFTHIHSISISKTVPYSAQAVLDV